jgi:putative oxidoreductase
MTTLASERIKDEVVLAARILLVILFLIFGSMKLTDYSGTVSYMAQTGAPLPPLAALVAILVETFLSIAVVLGAWTRPLAVLLAVYTLATGLIGHHYWTMTGAAQYMAEIDFYKNISIAGGFLLLFVTGAGKYSVDAKLYEKSGTEPGRQPRSA